MVMYILRGDVPRPVRTVRGDKELEDNCCLYLGFPLLIPPDLVNWSTSPCGGTARRCWVQESPGRSLAPRLTRYLDQRRTAGSHGTPQSCAEFGLVHRAHGGH